MNRTSTSASKDASPRRGGDRGDRACSPSELRPPPAPPTRPTGLSRPEPAEAAGVAAATETTAAATEGTAAMTEGTADPNAVVHTAETHARHDPRRPGGLHAVRLPQRHRRREHVHRRLPGQLAGRARSEGELNVGDLDPALFSTVENPEAGPMLKMGDWPLYRFAADAAPGDVNGQGVGEVWYVVGPTRHCGVARQHPRDVSRTDPRQRRGNDAVRLPQRHRGREHVHRRLPRQLAGCA